MRHKLPGVGGFEALTIPIHSDYTAHTSPGPLSASNWCLYPFKIGATIHLNNSRLRVCYKLKCIFGQVAAPWAAQSSQPRVPREPRCVLTRMMSSDSVSMTFVTVTSLSWHPRHTSHVTSASLSLIILLLRSLTADTCRGVPVTCHVTSTGHDTRILRVKYFPMLQPHHIYQQSIHTNLTLLDNVKITVLGLG